MSSLRLPCHPRHRNDEILSSWLLKIASDNIVPVKRLLERIDISRSHLDSMGSDDPRLVSIASAVGLSKKAVVPALPEAFMDCLETLAFLLRTGAGSGVGAELYQE